MLLLVEALLPPWDSQHLLTPSLTESGEELVWEVALWEVLVLWEDMALFEELAISEVMDLWEV